MAIPVSPPKAGTSRSASRRRLVGWVALSVTVVGFAAGLWLQWRVQRLGGVGPGRYRLLTQILIWQAVAIVTAFALQRVRARRVAAGLIVAGLLLIPAASLTRSSQISDDLYRYAWDGRLQAAGIDPYRYAPQAGELTSFRDDWLWPDRATCRALGKRVKGDDPKHGCTRINRPSVRTIYPPVAEGYFLLAHVIPGPARDHKLQLDGAVLSAALAGLLAFGLRRTGRDPLAVGYYVFGPMAAINAVGDAHVDVLGAIFAVGGVLLATLRPRASGRIGVLAGLAVAVKLYPVLVLPALLRRAGGRAGAMRLVAAAAGIVLLGYLPHIIAVGPDVLGYLPGYLREERYNTGTRFLLLGLLGIHGELSKLLAIAIIGSAALLVTIQSARDRISPAAGTLAVFGSVFLVATPSEPWYGLILLCLAILTGRLEWIAVVTAAYPLYVASLIRESPILTGRLSYAAAALLVLGIWAAREWRKSHKKVTKTTVDEPLADVGRMPL